MGYCGKHVTIRLHKGIKEMRHVYLYDHTNLFAGFTLISQGGNFILKHHAGVAENLTVVTGNHGYIVGEFMRETAIMGLHNEERDVVCEEDSWVGANCVLLSGVTVGRGAIVGAGSVVRNDVPPYSIVMGNPAKVVGFTFKLDEIIKHEEALYPEDKRIPIEQLEKNYEKYFLKRLMKIRDYVE